MKHLLVHSRPGMFYGWPANNGIWSWGNEIVVGFTEAHYLENSQGHSQDESRPRRSLVARSMDGGETWSTEEPANYPEGFTFGDETHGECHSPVGVPEQLDFTSPDLAIRCRNSQILVSHDRCRTWEGPYLFPPFADDSVLTARTDYLVLDAKTCLFFVSRKSATVRAGSFSDTAFAVVTRDGGRSFEELGTMLPERPEFRSVMPSTVRISDTTLVSALRRRKDGTTRSGGTYGDCWLDAAISDDLGRTWRFLSMIADTHARTRGRNGNPPALVRTNDGALCAFYGFRAPVLGMRAKVSTDNGASWSNEIVLSDDARTWDFGYPRAVVRPDGKVVVVYYYTTSELKEQHIAATIWDPKEAV